MRDITVPRRSFLARLAAGGAALGAAFGGVAALPANAEAAAKPDALDAWFQSMKGANKAIYDCTSPGSAPEGTFFAHNLLTFSHRKLGTKDDDFSVVVCYRHFATPFGYNDAMWAKYPQMAEMLKIDDVGTKKRAVRNWLLHEKVEGQANITTVREHGVQFAVCGAATEFIANALAGASGDAKAIEAELGANLVPGGRIVAAGVVAVQRAQKNGFAYTYAG